MTDGAETPNPQRGRGSVVRVLAALAVVIALGAAMAWWLRPLPAPATSPTSAQPAPASTPTPEPETSATAPTRPAPKAARPEPQAELPTEAPPPAPKPILRVKSDVDGAFVFVDKKFVGKTPLETSEVPTGRHDVNVSAEGYEGVAQGIDVGETGVTDLHIPLKLVRLDASVAVVHKHAIGSCDGTLRADPNGLRYDTANKDDAFALPFSDLEVFTVDYAQKTLRVKKRGGRTWNFTTRATNADPLLSFQHEVDKARARLAHGG